MGFDSVDEAIEDERSRSGFLVIASNRLPQEMKAAVYV